MAMHGPVVGGVQNMPGMYEGYNGMPMQMDPNMQQGDWGYAYDDGGDMWEGVTFAEDDAFYDDGEYEEIQSLPVDADKMRNAQGGVVTVPSGQNEASGADHEHEEVKQGSPKSNL